MYVIQKMIQSNKGCDSHTIDVKNSRYLTFRVTLHQQLSDPTFLSRKFQMGWFPTFRSS